MSAIIASAPGSLMLMGEHAVLHGHPALVLSLEQRISVTLTPLDEPILEISSPFGRLSFPLHQFPSHYPKTHEYVLHTLKAWTNQYSLPAPGFTLSITSDFEPGVGLGSSTAVVVATLKTLNHWLSSSLSSQELFSMALRLIREIQGMASGADIAASLYEGCLFYQEGSSTPLPVTPWIEWKFSGKKVPTAEVIQHVNALDKGYREAIFEHIHTAVLEGKKALEEKNSTAFAQSLKKNQKLMESLFLDTPALKETREKLEQDPQILAVKISGASMALKRSVWTVVIPNPKSTAAFRVSPSMTLITLI